MLADDEKNIRKNTSVYKEQGELHLYDLNVWEAHFVKKDFGFLSQIFLLVVASTHLY